MDLELLQTRKDQLKIEKYIGYNLEVKMVSDIRPVLYMVGLEFNQKNMESLSSIIGNFRLLLSYRNKNCLAFNTRTSYQFERRYNTQNLTRASIVRVLEHLVSEGFIKKSSGWHFEGNSKPTTWFIKKELRDIIECAQVEFVAGKEFVLAKKGRLMNYTDTDETIKSRDMLRSYNELLENHDVIHPDGDFGVAPISLVRIFRDVEESTGGRFYAPWQLITNSIKKLGSGEVGREGLRIDGKKCHEQDFRSMNVALLYAEEGLNVFDLMKDPYQIKSKVSPLKRIQRDAVKIAFFSMLYTSSKRSAIGATFKNTEEEGFEISESDVELIIDELIELHDPISDYFFMGGEFALRMQYLDSRVCEKVLELMTEQKILVLPVHDSFVCMSHHHKKVKKAMEDAFQFFYPGIIPVITMDF